MSIKRIYTCDLCGLDTHRATDFTHIDVAIELWGDRCCGTFVEQDLCDKCLKKPIRELLKNVSGKSA